MKPLLIIGLGNPGDAYTRTRHNAGFLFVDYCATHFGNLIFSMAKNGNVLVAQGMSGKRKVILAKPQDFMNASGAATLHLIQYYKVSPQSDLIVVHDDLDIASGQYKVSKDRGPAGQNGVIDIIDKLQTKNFTRFRIGIEDRNQEQKNHISGSDFVLGRFTKQQEDDLEETFTHLVREIENFIKSSCHDNEL